MEGFLHHMAPQFLHPAIQGFGCGAFRPFSDATSSFHHLYPVKVIARQFGEQHALAQGIKVQDNNLVSFPHRSSCFPSATEVGTAPLVVRDDTSSPGSATSTSPRPCNDEDSTEHTHSCSERLNDFDNDPDRHSSCGVCGARLSPGILQTHFLQELQHLYSLSALPRDRSTKQTEDEDARWETFLRIRANRQRRLKLKSRKRSLNNMFEFDFLPPTLDRQRVLRQATPLQSTSEAEDEPVDVEGDTTTSPEATFTNCNQDSIPEEKASHLEGSSYLTEDFEISSTNDCVQPSDTPR